MTDYVLIRLDNGAHAPVSKEYAELVGAKPLKRPAIDQSGRMARIKYPATSTSSAATETRGDSTASDNK